MNKNSRIIKILVILFVILISFNNVIFAEINAGGDDSDFKTNIVSILNHLGDLAINASFAGLATLSSGLAVALFLLINMIFSGMTGEITFPFPDKIILNKIAIFDPNFTAPDSNSITAIIKDTILQMFNSLQTVAIAVFAIAAMIIGIKLAISTLATEKAKYKEAITKWITGIVLLFTLRFIIAGIFYLNEAIVVSISSSVEETTFNVPIIQSIPIFGKLISTLFKDTWITEAGPPINGYGGLILRNIMLGIGGNIFCALSSFIILGQTIALIIMYLKRVFYAIVLRDDWAFNSSCRYNQ